MQLMILNQLMRRTIPFYIKQVLLTDRRVCVPGIGTISLNHRSARISENRMSIDPPTLEVDLEDNTQSNQRLAVFISRREQISVQEVREKIEAYVADLHDNLARSGSIVLPGIGNILRRGNRHVLEADINDITSAYTQLPALDLDAVKTQSSVIPEPINLPPKESTRTDLWPVLWGFLIGLGLIFLFSLIRGCNNEPSIVKKPTPAVIKTDTIDQSDALKTVDKEPRINSFGQVIPESGRCVIITGSLSKNRNILNMETLVGAKGYQVYTENYYQLTRVGLEFDCTDVDLVAFIQQVRSEIHPEAWYLDPRLEVPLQY